MNIFDEVPEQELSKSEIISQLEQDPHIKEICYLDFKHGEVNYSGENSYTLPENYPIGIEDEKRQHIDKLVRYLNSTVIVDDFETHHERREWRKQLPPQLAQFVKQDNALGKNNVQYRIVTPLLFLAAQGSPEVSDYLLEQSEAVIQLVNPSLTPEEKESLTQQRIRSLVGSDSLASKRIRTLAQHLIEQEQDQPLTEEKAKKLKEMVAEIIEELGKKEKRED